MGKPIDGFGARWDDLLSQVSTWTSDRRVLVVGGGAGGFELAVSMHARLKKELKKLGKDSTVKLKVVLVTRSGLLPQHTPGARALAEKTLRERGIQLEVGYDASHADSGKLHCKDGRTLPYDDCIWCTQGSPQEWLGNCGLKTDNDGFLLVDQGMRCSSAIPTGDIGPVFAGGDVASVQDHPRP